MRASKAAVTFILVTVTLDILAMGMIIPVLPDLILDFLGGQMISAANWNGWFALVFALDAVFLLACCSAFSPIGSAGGRSFLLSNLGLGLDYVVMALAPTISWLFLGRIISGITTSSIPTAMAYIADVTPKEKRAAAFGMIGIAFGVGFAFGPAIGGLLESHQSAIAFLGCGRSQPNKLALGLFFRPGIARRRNNDRNFRLRRANPVGSLDPVALASGTLAAGHDPVSRLHRAQHFQRLGALQHLSLRLERTDDWPFSDGRRNRHRHHFRHPDRTNGEALR